MDITCPYCKQTLEGDESFVGQSVGCPACNRKFVVPDPKAAHSVAPVVRPAPVAGKTSPKTAIVAVIGGLAALLVIAAVLSIFVRKTINDDEFEARLTQAMAAVDAEWTSDMTEKEKADFDAYMRAQNQSQSGKTKKPGGNSLMMRIGIRNPDAEILKCVEVRRKQAENAFDMLKANQLRQRRIDSENGKPHGPITLSDLNLSNPTPASDRDSSHLPSSSGSVGTIFQ